MTLQIFPKHPDADAYYVNGSYVPYAVVGRDKRFSDAELAAIYYMTHSVVMQFLGYMDKPGSDTDLRARDAQRRLEIIERFASTPHHDAQ